ncbi:MAG: ATP-binding cassette domain-containing protein [Defluviitaleaceae bacterium]|nr:ATP-binding cassette domain-containing protein [Defluviitaleaceae bacterium]
MISLKNVSKIFATKYGNVRAIHNVNVDIVESEIFGIIGHSGAGKSTLIRCINLLEAPTSGSVVVDGEDMTTLSKKALCDKRKKIGMIFQHFYLMPSRTVLQNVMLPLKGANMPKHEKVKKAEDLLNLVGLSHRVSAYPSALSGGEKQRVAIARALANDPNVLLCDEATSALDPQTTTSILNLLKEVNAKLGITIVLITHEMAVIKEICDRVAVMEGGEIKELGTVFDVFATPQSDVGREFVASTTSLHKVYELIEKNSPLTQLASDEILVKLAFTANNAQETLLHDAATRFGIKTNIFFGNVEFIQGKPIGNLVVIVKGPQENIDNALNYLQENEVSVKVL